ncbi:hypothetical protein GCM10009798_01590 [Nocardioides panacihumi]|uniref:Polysaccharide chain length determinant N-terminal domain-containing protein n=1 Tax=Nocardioides panacihumi TaxID=400774 RepID=A0ABP5BJD6_9ACTN
MHSEASPTVSLRLDQMAAALRRRWPTALLVLTAWLAVGTAVAALAPSRYEATSAVTVEPFADVATRAATATSPDMPTELHAVTSTAVLERAARELHVSRAAVDHAVSVANPDRSRVLAITYRGATGAAAARGADAVAAAYLDVRRAGARTQAQAEAVALQQRITHLRTQLPKGKAASSPIATADGQQLADLQTRLADLTLAADATGGQVTRHASDPTSESGPPALAYLAGALVLGLACAVAAALLRDRLSRRASDPCLLSSRIGAPVVAAARASSADDVLRTLALRLDLAARPAPHTIAVVGAPSPMLARALSTQLRRQGLRTRLADARSIAARNVDRGWPRTATDRVLVVDLNREIDGPLAATVASRCDLVILAVTKGTSMVPVDTFVSLLRAAGRDVDGAVFLHHEHALSAFFEAAPWQSQTRQDDWERDGAKADDTTEDEWHGRRLDHEDLV